MIRRGDDPAAIQGGATAFGTAVNLAALHDVSTQCFAKVLIWTSVSILRALAFLD